MHWISPLSDEEIAADIRRIAFLAVSQAVPIVIGRDPDDDHVLACALAARADLIDSGDQDLHTLGGNDQGIPIVTPAEGLKQLLG